MSSQCIFFAFQLVLYLFSACTVSDAGWHGQMTDSLPAPALYLLTFSHRVLFLPNPWPRIFPCSELSVTSYIKCCREALIQELRDAFLGLAESSTHSNAPQQAAQFEAHIRELHAALEAASDSPGPGTTPVSGAAHSEQWAITAVRTVASPQASPRSAASSPRQQQQQQPPFQRRPISSVLKSALKHQRPSSSCGWSPARPGANQGAAAPAGTAAAGAERTPRPPSARPACSAVLPLAQPGATPRPCTAPSAGQQQEQGRARGMDAEQAKRHPWQADDALAEYESMEQARCKTPRPFQASSEPHLPGFSREAPAPASSDGSPLRECGIHYVQLAVHTGMPAGQLPSVVSSRPASAAVAGSPPRSPPGSPGWPNGANPSEVSIIFPCFSALLSVCGGLLFALPPNGMLPVALQRACPPANLHTYMPLPCALHLGLVHPCSGHPILWLAPARAALAASLPLDRGARGGRACRLSSGF